MIYYIQFNKLSSLVHTMKFNDATDILFNKVTHEELANELGVSVALIRQARLPTNANAHRRPPKGWEKAISRLAERHGSRLIELARRLKKDA